MLFPPLIISCNLCLLELCDSLTKINKYGNNKIGHLSYHFRPSLNHMNQRIQYLSIRPEDIFNILLSDQANRNRREAPSISAFVYRDRERAWPHGRSNSAYPTTGIY
jgi:hypothetical protein